MSRSIHTTYKDIRGLIKRELIEQLNNPHSDLAILAKTSFIKEAIKKERKQKKLSNQMKG